MISRLEDFSSKVATRLDGLDRAGVQEIIRILVRRIEIDDARNEVIFRVPPPDGPSRPSPTDETSTWQHCTDVGRAQLRLDQPQSPFDPRFRTLRKDRRRIRAARHDPPHAQTPDQAKPLLMNLFFLDRLSARRHQRVITIPL